MVSQVGTTNGHVASERTNVDGFVVRELRSSAIMRPTSMSFHPVDRFLNVRTISLISDVCTFNKGSRILYVTLCFCVFHNQNSHASDSALIIIRASYKIKKLLQRLGCENKSSEWVRWIDERL